MMAWAIFFCKVCIQAKVFSLSSAPGKQSENLGLQRRAYMHVNTSYPKNTTFLNQKQQQK